MIPADEPYNELPELPPKQEFVITEKVWKALIPATRELAELKGAGDKIPNQNILLQAITSQESRDSSEIENIFTTNDELFTQSEAGGGPAKEVKMYQKALWQGHEAIKKRPVLSKSLLVSLVQTIKGNSQGIRSSLVYIRGEAKGTIYTPPLGINGLAINEKLDNFLEFAHSEYDYDNNGNKEKIDPLIKMAIMHYQFEAIHPFADGNGRTGRVVNILYLVKEGLLKNPILYLSRYINVSKNEYYRNLQNVTENNDWETWIVYILNGVAEMARYTKEMIEEIYAGIEATSQELEAKIPKKYVKEFVDIIYQEPYCRIGNLVDKNIGNRRTVTKYLDAMCEIGVLEELKVEKKKERIFKNIRLLKIMEKK